MNRREFLKATSAALVGAGMAPMSAISDTTIRFSAAPPEAAPWDDGEILLRSYFEHLERTQRTLNPIDTGLLKANTGSYQVDPDKKLTAVDPETQIPQKSRAGTGQTQLELNQYLKKMRNHYRAHKDDLHLVRSERPLLKSCLTRLTRIKKTVGHGNFYLVSFDEALHLARSLHGVGSFTKAEIDFLEKIFYQNAGKYGFYGPKPIKHLTHKINKQSVVSIRGTGNFLYRGTPVELYQKIRKDVGPEAILTSGVRSVIKQFHLFFYKAFSNKANLSLASRSLAPPGYSFHGVSDFDMGQAGLGRYNFTARFTRTKVFKRLTELDYVDLRYSDGNLLGVRFEPWHVKVDLHG